LAHLSECIERRGFHLDCQYASPLRSFYRLCGKFLLDHFTVADAYLYAVLNWSVGARVSLSRYPAIKEYHRRLRIRPSIAKAYQEEVLLYRAALASHRAA
jgi:glutathione S-transferase